MLRNIFLKSLRDNRAGVLAWGLGLALLCVVGATQYTEIVGAPGDERRRMAAEMAKAFQAFSFLLGEITSLDTIGGFITARVLGFVPVVLALWAAVLGVGLTRGEEQGGALDMLLSTPRSRGAVLSEKVAALIVAVLTMMAIIGAGLAIGIGASGEPLDLAGVVLAVLNMATITAFWGAVGLVLGQLVHVRRTASSIAGGLLFGTFLLNNIFEGLPDLKWITWLFPFHYYSVSKPLVPGRGMEWGAWLLLVAFTVGLILVAIRLFNRRDIGSTFQVFSPRRAAAQTTGKSRLLGSVFTKSVRDLIWPTFFWALGLAVYAQVMMATLNEALQPLRDIMQNIEFLALLVGDMATPEGYLGYALITYLPVLLAAFAITQIDGWSSDEEEGRLEVMASAPIPRWQLLAARYAAMLLAITAILIVLGISVLAGASWYNVTLDAGRLWPALAASLPVGMVVAAFGLCVATWLKRPGAAVPITIGVVATMFFLELFSPLLDLPDAVLNLSIFRLYGKPLTEGVWAGGVITLVVAAILLTVGSLMGLHRRDIAK